MKLLFSGALPVHFGAPSVCQYANSLAPLLFLFDGLHRGEQQDVADRVGIGEQHHEAIQAEAQAARGGASIQKTAVPQGVLRSFGDSSSSGWARATEGLDADLRGTGNARNREIFRQIWSTIGALWSTASEAIPVFTQAGKLPFFQLFGCVCIDVQSRRNIGMAQRLLDHLHIDPSFAHSGCE